jgi:hypothetical protein
MDSEILEEIKEDVKEDKPKKEKKLKQYEVINRENRPFEFHIINDWFRLEPRNKEGDKIILDENQISSVDFQICHDYVAIREVKK